MSYWFSVSGERATGPEIVPGGLRVRRHGHGARGPALPGGPLLSGGHGDHRYYLRACETELRPISDAVTRGAALDGGFWIWKGE